ncbi:cytochrome oxidase putative small subunit CydP [Dakarella massiliensis]|uniref:cytochrome oxidase putative small subunit CydP n=1 Tax=Dakarella massiliensis TaxID=1506471 RepID=UPI000670D156
MKKGTRKDQEKHLTLHLWLVIGVKVLCIFLLWLVFFSPSHRPDTSATAVGNAILDRPISDSQISAPESSLHRDIP